jgi:putative serine protease PepD
MNTKSSAVPYVVAAIVAALGLGAGIGATTYSVLADESATVVHEVTVTESDPVAQATGLSIAEIAEEAQQSVVEITAEGTSVAGQPQQQAVGSGFVWDREGHVVTNQHVVNGASSISVELPDGTTYSATVVGTDASTDLAIIRVDAPVSKLVPLQLGDSSDLRVGDPVVAIGSPFGLAGTVTSGIVSALHRQMTAPNRFTITDSIQTDAAINHGNSGGPLLDARGRVIGVNAQIESDSGGNDGVGFAIPSNTVRSVATQIIETGKAEHAYLGITMVATSDGLAVTEVRAGTPAETAGLRAATGTEVVDGEEVPTGGDVIVAFGGKPVSTTAELQSAVDARKPGDEITVTVLRNGERRTLEVTLGTRPERIDG